MHSLCFFKLNTHSKIPGIHQMHYEKGQFSIGKCNGNEMKHDFPLEN